MLRTLAVFVKMGKGSKRRTGEDTNSIVTNWDEIDWDHTLKAADQYLKSTKEEADKKKNDRKRINDNDRGRD